MTELSVPQLAGACFQQGLEIFRDVWNQEVDQRLRQYFGATYIAHLESIHNSPNRVIIDFDRHHGTVNFEFNAILYLLLEDGGLRRKVVHDVSHEPTSRVPAGHDIAPSMQSYVPKLFGFAHEFTEQLAPATVLVFPDYQHVKYTRETRNLWAHQQEVTVFRMYTAMQYMIEMCNVLPQRPSVLRAVRGLQICEAYLFIYQTRYEEHNRQAGIHKQQQQTMQQLRKQLANMTTVQDGVLKSQQHMQTQITAVQDDMLPIMTTRIDTLQRDQNLLLTGIMASLTDVQQLSAADVTQLRADIVALREVARAYRPLQQQLHEAMHLVAAQHATITDLEQQIDRMRALFTASAIKTSPLQHGASAITAKAPTYHVGELSEPIPVIVPYTRWRIVLFVVIALICGLALWLQASLASWIAPMFP